MHTRALHSAKSEAHTGERIYPARSIRSHTRNLRAYTRVFLKDRDDAPHFDTRRDISDACMYTYDARMQTAVNSYTNASAYDTALRAHK